MWPQSCEQWRHPFFAGSASNETTGDVHGTANLSVCLRAHARFPLPHPCIPGCQCICEYPCKSWCLYIGLLRAQGTGLGTLRYLYNVIPTQVDRQLGRGPIFERFAIFSPFPYFSTNPMRLKKRLSYKYTSYLRICRKSFSPELETSDYGNYISNVKGFREDEP